MNPKLNVNTQDLLRALRRFAEAAKEAPAHVRRPGPSAGIKRERPTR